MCSFTVLLSKESALIQNINKIYIGARELDNVVL